MKGAWVIGFTLPSLTSVHEALPCTPAWGYISTSKAFHVSMKEKVKSPSCHMD